MAAFPLLRPDPSGGDSQCVCRSPRMLRRHRSDCAATARVGAPGRVRRQPAAAVPARVKERSALTAPRSARLSKGGKPTPGSAGSRTLRTWLPDLQPAAGAEVTVRGELAAAAGAACREDGGRIRSDAGTHSGESFEIRYARGVTGEVEPQRRGERREGSLGNAGDRLSLRVFCTTNRQSRVGLRRFCGVRGETRYRLSCDRRVSRQAVLSNNSVPSPCLRG